MNQINNQHWILLGTSNASKKIWGINNIKFPCGYNLPQSSFALNNLTIENQNNSRWVIGGIALEISKKGKNLSSDNISEYIKGYRQWICIYENKLINYLKKRNHSIMIWDKGVSIFYSLWHDNSHVLSDLINKDDLSLEDNIQTSLEIDSTKFEKGESINKYLHKEKEIITFMSEFMTISDGDIFILGPIVAKEIKENCKNIILKIGTHVFSTKVEQKN